MKLSKIPLVCRPVRNALKVLPLIGQRNQQEINLLAEIVEGTEDPKIRWDAAAILGNFEPSHPQAAIYRNKYFNFDLSFEVPPENLEVELQVALLTIDNRKILAQIEVKPMQGKSKLPNNLEFAILDDQGQLLREEISRDHHDSLEMSFRFEPGDHFRIRLTSGDSVFIEDIEI
ncbi:MAG: DUF1822 family protein [Synechococcaceae cyanobacterium RL_1_2]|nr:DUF1822 family protein [Synechococcaceae cyanobacterium RL_1_2]